MAISVIQQWIALAAGTTSINSTGADCLVVVNEGFDSGFTTGKANPTTLTYNGVDIEANAQYSYINDGSTNDSGVTLTGNDGTAASNGFALWVYCGFSAGTHDLVLTNQAGTYGGGPRAAYALFSGVDQTTPVRTASVKKWNRLVTAASIAFSGLTAGDLLNVLAGDFNDTTHTATGSATEVLESAAVNGSSIWAGQFTATGATATMGLSGGTDVVGIGLPLIPASGSTDATATPTGVAGTGAVGSPTIITSCTFVPTGVSGTGAVGDPTIVTGQLVIPTGVAGTGAVGDPLIVADVSVSLTGVEGTGAVGDPTINFVTNVTVVPDGVFGQTALGVLTLLGFDVWSRVGDTVASWAAQGDNAVLWNVHGNTTATWTKDPNTSGTWTEQTDTPKTWTEQ